MLRQARVGPTNFMDVFDVGVSDEERRFIDTPAEFLVIATYGPDTFAPYLLYDDVARPVGFAALRAPVAPGAPAGLARFLISTGWQRRGLGARHLALLLERAAAEWPASREIVLSVHADAAAAQALYMRAGFRPEGAQGADHVTMRRPL